MIYKILLVLDYIAIFYFFLVNITYIILNILAFFSIRKKRLKKKILDIDKPFSSEFYKPLSIIVPAYNEEKTIVDNLKSILELQYPEYEVVVVNDGSNDQTLQQLFENFNLKAFTTNYKAEIKTEPIKCIYKSTSHPNLIVIDKENGGKADSLNAGINMSSFPLVCNIDADSLIDSEALLKIVEPFVNDWKVVAAGGTIRVANKCKVNEGQVKEVNLSKNFLVRMQVVEYLRAFLFGRVGWASINSLLIISGAFGVFKKKHLIRAGGYNPNTVGEDMELVLRLNRKMKEFRRNHKIVFLPDPVCWTQVPKTIASLSNQRKRWQRGLGESLFYNIGLFFNYKHGTIGLIAFPFYFFVEFLGPILESIGYISLILTFILGYGNQEIIILFLISSILLGILLSLSSLFFEEMSFRKYEKTKEVIILAITAVLENFGYKQLNTFWRLIGLYELIVGNKEWGNQIRSQFSE
ncbi:MAG TPA: glycosyltransferase family 2 protein [Halanaerobiales bacterium]|nr:glycosyltransferase family 2 protein [Halanaerobiales bacterium]